ncbi:MAG: signal peptide peptidase SppA [Nitrospirae bacterium]|nr:signal peptide peptidase SppA [Nitrospirota bacterium]
MRQRLAATIILASFLLSLLSGLVLIFQLRKEAPPSSELPALTAGRGRDVIGVVKIYGIINIQRAGGAFALQERGADYYVDRIKRLSDSPRVKAIILRINSPGGSVGASQEIYNEILRARAKGKKVIVSMGDVAASGGYYISSAADYILANPGTVTGSIGVVIGNINFQELMSKWGLKMNIIKSGKYKDILSSWRQMTEEERTLLQKMVDSVYMQFVTAVAKGRHLKIEKVQEIADGRVFTGEEALKLKLIDQLGGFQEAIRVAAEKAGIKGKPVLNEGDKFPWERFFLSSRAGPKEEVLSKLLAQLEGSHLPVQYIYYPPSL